MGEVRVTKRTRVTVTTDVGGKTFSYDGERLGVASVETGAQGMVLRPGDVGELVEMLQVFEAETKNANGRVE
jgi:poly(A) polymerase Pap1